MVVGQKARPIQAIHILFCNWLCQSRLTLLKEAVMGLKVMRILSIG